MVVNTTTVNLTTAELDMKLWPRVGTHPIKIEGEETRHLKEHNPQHQHTEAITEVEEHLVQNTPY
jgi:hypothetical protein